MEERRHFTIDELRAQLATKPDGHLTEALAFSVLKLTPEELETLLFVFLLCRIAERDMGAVFSGALDKLEKIVTPEAFAKAKADMNAFMEGERFTEPPLDEVLIGIPKDAAAKIRATIDDRYREKSKLDVDHLDTFGDKILAYQTVKSKNSVSKMLWKLKTLRDDISHGRIQDLAYEDASLMDRATKERLFFDYMEAVTKPNHTKSGLDDFLKGKEGDAGALMHL